MGGWVGGWVGGWGRTYLFLAGDKGGVAEVISLHDGGVQGGEIEGGDGLLVEGLLGLDDRGAWVGWVGGWVG